MPPNRAARGKFQVLFVGEPEALQRSFAQLDRESVEFNRRVDRQRSKLAKFGIGLTGALVAFGHVTLQVANAARDAEVSDARLQAQLHALGLSSRTYTPKIQAVVQRVSQLSGLDDEDVQDAFTTILRSTGNVTESERLVAVATDIARAKHINLANAATIVARVSGGNVGILRRYGIEIDKDASSAEALATLTTRFHGQAETYGNTTQGAYERFRVATENLKETVGTKLLPAVTDMALFGIRVVNRTADVVRTVDRATRNVADWVRATVDSGIAGIRDTPGALLDGGKWIARQLYLGATGQKGLIRDAADWLLGQMLGGVKGLFSPSVWFGIGRAVVEGIVKGIGGALVTKLIDVLGGIGRFAAHLFGDKAKPGTFGLGGMIGTGTVEGAIAVMSAIASKHLPYTYGGGHGMFGVGNPGFDCSGYVSVALGVLGAIGTPMAVREPMASALLRGDGRRVTVGIRGTSGMNAHTMIKLDGKYFESGGGHGPAQVGGWDGAFEHFHPRGFAEGGDFTVDGPYTFLTGEKGPERVQIRPATPRILTIPARHVASTTDAHALAHHVAFAAA